MSRIFVKGRYYVRGYRRPCAVRRTDFGAKMLGTFRYDLGDGIIFLFPLDRPIPSRTQVEAMNAKRIESDRSISEGIAAAHRAEREEEERAAAEGRLPEF